MSLQDRIFLDFKEAIETFLRMGFELTPDKRLVSNDLEVVIRSIGSSIWRTSVERVGCKQVQNKPLNPVVADNAKEEYTQRVDDSCDVRMSVHTVMLQNKP